MGMGMSHEHLKVQGLLIVPQPCHTMTIIGVRSQLTFSPVSSSNSAMDPMTTTSFRSSEAQIGMGVPQKRERLTHQSRAFCSQSITASGTSTPCSQSGCTGCKWLHHIMCLKGGRRSHIGQTSGQWIQKGMCTHARGCMEISG